jgi:hypothetical protein
MVGRKRKPIHDRDRGSVSGLVSKDMVDEMRKNQKTQDDITAALMRQMQGMTDQMQSMQDQIQGMKDEMRTTLETRNDITADWMHENPEHAGNSSPHHDG